MIEGGVIGISHSKCQRRVLAGRKFVSQILPFVALGSHRMAIPKTATKT